MESWNNGEVLESNLSYLEKIIELCKEKNVELNIVFVPLAQVYLEEIHGGEAMHTYFQQLCEKNNLTFYDFNYYINRENEFGNEMFRDYHHMNVAGAKYFSNKLVEIYQADKNGEDVNKYFKE